MERQKRNGRAPIEFPMLRTLRIRQFVIIEDLTVEFESGLSLLTGETGAGKSILVDALGLAVGHRGDRTLIRAGSTRAIVEALFDVAPDSAAWAWAETQEITELFDNGEILIRRELPAEGTGRVTVNGSPFTLSLLRELGQRLLELHGQHEHQSLLSPERHLRLLDRAGGNAAQLRETRSAYRAVLHQRATRDELRQRAVQRQQRKQELEHAIREIEAVNPRSGELAELDRERALLRNAEGAGRLLDELVGLCYEGEPNAAELAAGAARRAEDLANLDGSLQELAERLDSTAVELQDIGAAFRDYREHADFNPERLEVVENRRVALERLCLRYGADEAAVLESVAAAQKELASLRDLDQQLETADRHVEKAEQDYRRKASRLSRARRAAAKRLVPAVEAQFRALALEKAAFRVELLPARGEALGPSKEDPVPLGPRGADRAEFLLAANPGEPFRSLGKIASGGELSRIMLALHAVLDDASEGRALVFDEVDAGVGGAVADAVGARLARLAERQQVLCVTHLPQVAAYADGHYRVIKRVSDNRTFAQIVGLSGEDRVEELARMLGGKRPTPVSRKHAAELLTAAGRGAPGAWRERARRKA
jgi:DNA repair protein RecN (Recombination protein N)